jgi:hypothetical protein
MSDLSWDIDFSVPATNDDYCPMSELRHAYCALACCNDVPVDEAFLAGMRG